jgi:parallel beta-helix repeat protein
MFDLRRTAAVSTVAIAAFAVWTSVAGAAPAEAAAVACGDVITQDTTLTQDLTNCTDDGLVVAAPNVTLDLGGHTVAGWGNGAGIRIKADNVTVRNGRVTDFFEGVFAEGSMYTSIAGGTVSNLTLRRDGISLLNAYGWTIDGNDIAWGRDGIYFYNADQTLVTSNRVARFTGDGLYSVGASDGVTVSANKFVDNLGNGIYVSNSTTYITDNVASSNGANGIKLLESPGFPDRITSNTAIGNGLLGITAEFPGFDGGGNVARLNRDARQCVNVTCSPH